MTRPYLEDLRERALLRSDAGKTKKEIAAVQHLSASCVSIWRKAGRLLEIFEPNEWENYLTYSGYAFV